MKTLRADAPLVIHGIPVVQVAVGLRVGWVVVVHGVGLELKFYDGSSTGVGSELELKNNIFYDNTTTYIEEHDCTTNCYSSSGLLYENPDLKDVDEATEKYDCTLQWVSPCINGGASGMTADPDNTIIDIGAYYFHITLGDLNADSDWNVLDINTMTAYIMNPDPATPTSTMLDDSVNSFL